MRTPTVATLIIEHGKILLVKHGPGARHVENVYGLPSGRIDEGETETQAAVRELQEETGLFADESNLEEFPGNYYETTLQLKKGPEDFSWRVFLCRKYSGLIRGENEETTPEWVPLDQLDSLQLLPNINNALEAAQNFITLHD